MKRLGSAIAAGAIALAVCTAGTAMAATPSMTLTAHLKGSNEVGAAGASHGTGLASVRFYKSTSRICYTLTVSGFKLPALAAHIHAGHAGVNGPVLVPFPNAPGKTGKATGCVTVKSSVYKAISGHPSSYYVNVHTAAYPAGAVRGQLG